LKGLSLELQPVLSRPDLRTSVLLFGGTFNPTWRDLQWRDDNTLGASWLTEWGGARFTANVLHNERGANTLLGFGERSQDVASLAAEAPFTLGRTRWRAEGEFAFLRGDPDGPDLPAGEDGDDEGWFAQLS